MRRGTIGAALLLLLGGCDTSAPPPDADEAVIAPLEITDRANGQTLHLKVGQELTVTLGECSDCARKWTVAERPPILSETAKADLGGGSPETSGGNAIVQYLFRAERAGTGRLVLANRAPAPAPAAPGPTLTFTVEVR